MLCSGETTNFGCFLLKSITALFLGGWLSSEVMHFTGGFNGSFYIVYLLLCIVAIAYGHTRKLGKFFAGLLCIFFTPFGSIILAIWSGKSDNESRVKLKRILEERYVGWSRVSGPIREKDLK